MKHTELPWSYGGQYYNDWGGKYEAIMEPNGVDEVVGENSLSAEDAAFIVKAVNNFDRLVGMLKNVAKSIEDSDEWWMDCPDRGGFDLELINEILKQAEES